jgi:uncharacterized protein (DUF4415 family)
MSFRPALQLGAKYVQASVQQSRKLQELAGRPDCEIDLSDIPEIQEVPSDAIIARFYCPKKTTVTIRLDSDVLTWLKARGEGYQTRINVYLWNRIQKNRQVKPNSEP